MSNPADWIRRKMAAERERAKTLDIGRVVATWSGRDWRIGDLFRVDNPDYVPNRILGGGSGSIFIDPEPGVYRVIGGNGRSIEYEPVEQTPNIADPDDEC